MEKVRSFYLSIIYNNTMIFLLCVQDNSDIIIICVYLLKIILQINVNTFYFYFRKA